MSNTLRALLCLALVLTACGDDEKPEVSPNMSTNNTSTNNSAIDMGMANNTSSPDAGDDAGEPDPYAPERLFDYGDYAVGYRELEFTYTPVGSTEDRVIPVKVWYPAPADSDAEGATYAVGGIINVPTELALDAPAPAEGPFPLAIYSHGSGGEGLLAYPYAEFMATHGWVTVAPNHVGNTALDGLSGNELPFANMQVWRVSDITETLDAVDAGLDVDLTGLADLDQVFLYGHSFGAYTTLAAAGADIDITQLQMRCMNQGDQESCNFLMEADVRDYINAGFGDERIDAIVAQAPAAVQTFADGELGAGIDVPTMVQTGDVDTSTTLEEQSRPAWEGLDGPDDLWVRMPMGAHLTFITICDDLSEQLLLQFRSDALTNGCGPDFIPTTDAIPALRGYLYAFATAHVLGDMGWLPAITGEPFTDGFDVTTK